MEEWVYKMRTATFKVVVEDLEEGDDRIKLFFEPESGDEQLMIDVIEMITLGGEDPEFVTEEY